MLQATAPASTGAIKPTSGLRKKLLLAAANADVATAKACFNICVKHYHDSLRAVPLASRSI
jgi:hypothetical protein